MAKQSKAKQSKAKQSKARLCSYLRMLGDYIEFAHHQWTDLGMKCRVHYLESFNAAELARRLMHHGERADGVVFMALEHPLVRDAVDALAAGGIPAITMISDLSNAPRRAGLRMWELTTARQDAPQLCC